MGNLEKFSHGGYEISVKHTAEFTKKEGLRNKEESAQKRKLVEEPSHRNSSGIDREGRASCAAVVVAVATAQINGHQHLGTTAYVL